MHMPPSKVPTLIAATLEFAILILRVVLRHM